MGIIKKFRIKSFKNSSPIIKLQKISLSFDKRMLLDNISFNLNQGEILGLLGPNGVGKSTIFNLITGILKPDFGSILINNKTFGSFRRDIAITNFFFCPPDKNFAGIFIIVSNSNFEIN